MLITVCAPIAHALTMTQSYSVAERYTAWSQNFSVEKFDPVMGVLTGVEIDYSAYIHNTASFAYAGSGTGKFSAKLTNNFYLYDWNGDLIDLSRTSNSTGSVVWKKTASNYNFDPGTNSITGEMDFTDYLNSFIGSNSMSFSMSLSNQFTLSALSGSGISMSNALTTSTALFSVIYTYLPAPAPDLAPARMAFAPVADGVLLAAASDAGAVSGSSGGGLLAAASDSAALPEPPAPALLILGLLVLAIAKRKRATPVWAPDLPVRLKHAC